MAFTDNEYIEVRTWLPWITDADRIAVDDAHDRLNRSKWAVIVEYLRARLMQMLDAPGSMTITGEYAENWSANITALERRLVEAEGYLRLETEATTTGSLARLARYDPVRNAYFGHKGCFGA